MSVSHSAQYEPTHNDVWSVLEELPHRIKALLKRHESSRELGFEALERELHALFTHAECAATRAVGRVPWRAHPRQPADPNVARIPARGSARIPASRAEALAGSTG